MPTDEVKTLDLAGHGEQYKAVVVAEAFFQQDPHTAAPDGLFGAEGLRPRPAARHSAGDAYSMTGHGLLS